MRRLLLLVLAVLLVVVVVYAKNKLSEPFDGQDSSPSTIEKEIIFPEQNSYLWDSAMCAAHLIENTVEPCKGFSLEFLLCGDDKHIFQVQIPRTWFIDDQDDDYAKNFSIRVIDELLNAKSVERACDTWDKVEVTGIILRWVPEKSVLSVYDVANDGQWDYVYDGGLFFTENPRFMVKDSDGNQLPIGRTGPKKYELVPVDDGVTKLAELRKLVAQNYKQGAA